jgi:hypothetical protein
VTAHFYTQSSRAATYPIRTELRQLVYSAIVGDRGGVTGRTSKNGGMRRRPLCSPPPDPVLAAALLAPASPALAHPTSPLDPTLPTDLTFASTDNVEYLGRFPEHTGTAGGARSADGKRFYLTDPRGVYVYDTTTPAEPELLGSIRLFQTTTGAALAQEDPDTDDRILLVDAATTPVGRRPCRWST